MNDSFDPPGNFARAIDALDWSPRFATLPARFFTVQAPSALPAPHLVAFNPDAAPLIGLDPSSAGQDRLAAAFSGNLLPTGAAPLAAVYAGHQFGVYVPQLGDGRAISLGEVVGSEGICDIQLIRL